MNIALLPQKEIERFGEHVSIIYDDKPHTNVENNRAAKRLANALCSLGVKKGDRIILQMPNCPEIVQSFVAVYSVGAVVVPINYMVGEAETRFIYKDTGAKIIISTVDFWPKIQTCKEGVETIKHVILIDDEVPPETISYKALAVQNSPDFEAIDVDKNDLAALIYTAGTTGNPKGVMHTHGTLLENVKMQHTTFNIEPGMTRVTALPLCHSYGIAGLNYTWFNGGGTSVLLKQLDIEAIFQNIEKYKANTFAAVPTIYVYMLAMADKLKQYDISSMKYWTCGSAPLTLDTWKRFKAEFGYEITEGWGLTEAGANNSCNPLEGHKKVGSIGKPMEGTRMKIVDVTGQELPPGEQGEILISSPAVMKGYWNNPEETQKAFIGEWLYTGDIGYTDEDGYFFIKERKKDLIIKGGENIAPREVEEVIMSHPDVAEVAVIGIPDDTYGENIKAFVVRQPEKDISEKDIIEFCTKSLKRFKTPKKVDFLDALPKNLVGKILRKELRKMQP